MTKDTKDTTSPPKKSPSPITTLVADPPPPSKHRSSPKSFSPATLPPIIYEDPITKILEAENELRKAEENGDTKLLEKVNLSELLEKDLQERVKDNNTIDDTANCKAGSSTAIVGNSIVQDMRSTSFDTDYDNIQRLPSVADTQNVSEQKGDTSELPTEVPNDTVRKEIFAAMVEEEKLMMMSSPIKEQKDTDLESQPLDNNESILQDANVRPTSPTNQGLPEVEAYLVDKDDVVIATPTQPWYKQKRMIMLISLAFIIAILSIVLGVTLSSSSNNNESNENISSSNTAATEEGVVTTTSSSGSIAPSSTTFSVFVPVSESVAPSPPSLATDLSDTDISQAPTPSPCYNINMNIEYDGYPAETSFQLYKVDIDGSKEIIKSHSAKVGDLFYNETMCLQEGMYAYTMFDADGICCSYGNGSYNITDADGTLIVEGGEFKQVEMTKFSLPYVTDSPPPVEEVIPLDEEDECYKIEITIEYDGYPAETSWELHRLVYNGGEDELVDSHAGSSGETSFNQTICLLEGEYDFTIIDPDGICCSYGQGNYNISTPNGGVLAEGGEFTGSESSVFVFPFD